MNPNYLDFEQPIADLETKIQELRQASNGPALNIDKEVQALQDKHGLAYMFISHDLRVIRALADEVLVMRNGVVVERGPALDIFERPREEYTRALIAAAFNLETAAPGAASA